MSREYQGYLNIRGYKDVEVENRGQDVEHVGDLRNLAGAARTGVGETDVSQVRGTSN
jgi:hypothetical protein